MGFGIGDRENARLLEEQASHSVGIKIAVFRDIFNGEMLFHDRTMPFVRFPSFPSLQCFPCIFCRQFLNLAPHIEVESGIVIIFVMVVEKLLNGTSGDPSGTFLPYCFEFLADIIADCFLCAFKNLCGYFYRDNGNFPEWTVIEL